MPLEITQKDFENMVRQDATKAAEVAFKDFEQRIAAEMGRKYADVIDENEEVRSKITSIVRSQLTQAREEQEQQRDACKPVFTLSPERDADHPYVRMAGPYMSTDYRADGRTGKSTFVGGKGYRAARWLRASLEAARTHRSIGTVLEDWGDRWMIDEAGNDVEDAPKHILSEDSKRTLKRQLGSQTPASGGVLVPPSYLAEMIELLRGESVFEAASPIRVPIPNEQLTVPRATGSPTVSNVAEFQSVNATTATTGQLVMTLKKLMATVPVSNDLLAIPDAAADAFIRDMLVEEMREEKDRDALRGNGASNSVVGLRFQNPGRFAGSNSSDATPTAQQATDDFVDLLSLLSTSNIRRNRPAWFVNPRSVFHLISMRNSDDDETFPALISQLTLARPVFYGAPMFMTTHIPSDATGSDDTEIIYCEMSQVYYGFKPGMEMEVELLPNAAYQDSSGNARFGASEDSSVIRIKAKHEVQLRHLEAVAGKIDVLY